MKNIFHKIFENWPAKILCLLIAASLWIYVGVGQTRNTEFPGGLPLEFKNIPENMVAITDTDKVEIRIVAEKDVYDKLSSESFSAYVDMLGFKEGLHEANVVVLSHVSNVQIVEITPPKVVVRLEPKVDKEVPINCLIDGKAGEGLAPGLCVPGVEKVKVSGAKSVINGLQVATARIELTGETADFKRQVKLAGIDAKGKDIANITFNPSEILISVPIVKSSTIKTVGIKVNVTGTPAEGFWISKIETEPLMVTVTAAENIINQVNFIETDALDIGGIDKNKTVEIELKPASGVTLVEKVDKIKVLLTVSKNQATREIEAGFKWLNLASNLKVSSTEPTKVKVIVTGSQDKLIGLNPGDIEIVVDLSGISEAGTHSIDISRANISGPPGVSISSIVPSAINVRVDNK